jgi:hypothetical protein
MTNRRPLDDAELRERLRDLSGELAWPVAPDLAGRVTAALAAGTVRRRNANGVLGRLRELTAIAGFGTPHGRRVARRVVIITLIALLTIVVAVAALNLGVPGIRIEVRPTATASASASGPRSSTLTPSPAPTARATLPGQESGPTVSLDQARTMAGFGLLLPTATGYARPSDIQVTGVQPFARVTLGYPDHTMLTEFLGKIQPDAFQKIVGGGTTVAPVRVGTSDGWWIAGAPHQLILLYRDPDGQARWQEVTVTGNVLLWQAGDVTLRLETPLDRAAAIAVATSLR